jgi:Kelch motif
MVVVVAVMKSGGTEEPKPHAAGASHQSSSSSSSSLSHSRAIPAIEAGLLPWSLPAPLSREVVLPGTGDSVTVVGGIDSSGNSASAVVSLNTSTGATSVVGSLAAPLHDAAGAQLRGRDLLFGGGSPTTIAAVESLAAHSASNATVIGQLPQPRSDASAVTIGDTVYIVGGYDGTDADDEVLSSVDGQRFNSVSGLPVPVRYPAVAAFDRRIYVFGGEAVGGSHNGSPVDTVQMVDPASKAARVVGHLAEAAAGSAAAVVGGHLYVAGGSVVQAAAEAGSGATTTSSGAASSAVYAFDPSTGRMLRAGTLPEPVAYGGTQVVGDRAWIVGGESNGVPVSSVEMLTPNKAFGTAGASGAGSPYFGDKLLVADRGNNRLLLLDDKNQIVWSYPSVYAAAPPGGFYFPDDAFFARHGTEIISNQEENETIVIIAFPSGQLLWQYGHPRQPSSDPGYLHEPDDAYLLKNGQVTVADADNCRVLFINPDKTVASQIGTNDVCAHRPPTELGSPNGDTPLADGNVLVSEINGQWVSEYTPARQLVWSVHLPINYPSDPQQIGPDLYLVSDYALPGAIVEFNREGQVLYKYSPASGLGELNQPSLTELMPSGVFISNDDYRDRMVAIDPATQALVWQYGTPDSPGTAPGMLNIPDGFDLLLPDGSTPTHTATG